RLLADCCLGHGLARLHLPAFKRRLVEMLRGTDPGLSGRVARLRGASLSVLYLHFREPPPALWEQPAFTAEEVGPLAAACLPGPLVRRLKAVLARELAGPMPELARKLAGLSGRQFEQLYEQLCRRRA